jgi:hypothetical protein
MGQYNKTGTPEWYKDEFIYYNTLQVYKRNVLKQFWISHDLKYV